VALVAAFGILFVLITPAADELPSTGPHALNKTFALIASYYSPLAPEIFTGPQLQFVIHVSLICDDLISLTCARLC
jgi:hypothetical protein